MSRSAYFVMPARLDSALLISELLTAGIETVGFPFAFVQEADGRLRVDRPAEWTQEEIDGAAAVIAAHNPPPPPTPAETLATAAGKAIASPSDPTALAARAAVKLIYQAIGETRAAVNAIRADLLAAGLPTTAPLLLTRTWEEAKAAAQALAAADAAAAVASPAE